MSIKDFWGTENESSSSSILGILEDLKEIIHFKNSSKGLTKDLRKFRKDAKLQFAKVFEGFRDFKDYYSLSVDQK